MAFHTQEPLTVMHTNVSLKAAHVTGFRRFGLSPPLLHVPLLTDSCTHSSWETAFPPPTVCWELCPAGCLSPIHTTERLQG